MVIDIDKGLLHGLLQGGKDTIRSFQQRGLTSEHLDGEMKDAFEFALDYMRKYGDCPTNEIIETSTGITIEEVVGSTRYYEDQVHHRALFREMQRFGTEFSNCLERKDAFSAFTEMEKTVRTLRAKALVQSRVQTLFSLAPEVKERYLRMKRGERGILTRWPTVNNATLGFWPHETHLFTARTGVGKTWSSIIITLDAWQGVSQKEAGVRDYTDVQGNVIPYVPKKHKVLYVTTEMARETIAMRFFCVKQGVDYQKARSGDLTPFQEVAYLDMLDKIVNEDGIYIVGGEFDYTIDGLCAAIDEVEPDLLVFDGAYLLKGEGTSRTEKAADSFNSLKRALMSYPVSAVVTNQLNRQAKASDKKTLTADTIATTDVAGWNADTAIAMFQSEDMKEQKRMIYKFMKAREAFVDELELNWNLNTMDFSELDDGSAAAGGGGSSGDMAEPSDFSDEEVPGDDFPF